MTSTTTVIFMNDTSSQNIVVSRLKDTLEYKTKTDFAGKTLVRNLLNLLIVRCTKILGSIF
jgi:hypothetical protein